MLGALTRRSGVTVRRRSVVGVRHLEVALLACETYGRRARRTAGRTTTCRCPRVRPGPLRGTRRATAWPETPAESGPGRALPRPLEHGATARVCAVTVSGAGIGGDGAAVFARDRQRPATSIRFRPTDAPRRESAPTSIAPDSTSAARYRRTFHSNPCRVSPPSTSSTVVERSSAAIVPVPPGLVRLAGTPRPCGRSSAPVVATASTAHDTTPAPCQRQVRLVAVGPHAGAHASSEHDADGVGPRRRSSSSYLRTLRRRLTILNLSGVGIAGPPPRCASVDLRRSHKPAARHRFSRTGPPSGSCRASVLPEIGSATPHSGRHSARLEVTPSGRTPLRTSVELMPDPRSPLGRRCACRTPRPDRRPCSVRRPWWRTRRRSSGSSLIEAMP